MAGELVGGAFLSAFLQVAFDRLSSPKILDYFQGRKLNDRLLRKLKITLISINAVIDDAEEKQIRNPNVKRWVDELKEAVFAAEDLLDEIETEISIQELEAELHDTSSKVPNLSTAMASASVNLFDKEIESRIEEVLGHLDDLVQQKDLLGLKDGFGVGGKQSQRVPSTSLVDETKVYGRDADKDDVMNSLFSGGVNGSCFSVVSIVAMGGMGKTTLAQLVYNDGRVTDHFDIKSWIYVSDEFDVINLTKKFLHALGVPAHDSEDLNILQLKLKDKLIDKKFLLVLDDVWDEKSDTWERLLLPLIHGAPGSKVLATTRSERVAEVMHSISKHPLRQLGGEEGWELFCRHAFDGRDSDVNPDLEAIGRKIVDKCKGLPLAIKTLGGLLRTKYEEKEWNMILRSNIWDFNDAESNIIPALRLSYHYLPSHLKRCFSYCSIFPKGRILSENELILLWMAEGLLQHSKQNKRMEEVGEEYFRDLVARSFFQKLHSDFVMHDLIIDLATSVSGEFCYKLEKDIKNIPKRTRHLSISGDFYDTSTIFDGSHNYQYSNLRTFMLQG
ncbi:Disease resistance protein [Quillaja saponaria]|uniref:Disease resistance protein n=1 Tax=Quillaja saponaria TaxID=32244 RepID=A0AAD7L0W1_QUISA|nr:Disease resistance protein [Quillaja saponaria]KAJ7949373.1 Disease resistance protein [Quillaja saponaria]